MNGEPILFADFDRRSLTETFFNSSRQPLLTASYSPAGALIALTPVSPLPSLNVTYSASGALRTWHFDGLLAEFTYDSRSGNVEQMKFGAREIYRYIYRHAGQVKHLQIINSNVFAFI